MSVPLISSENQAENQWLAELSSSKSDLRGTEVRKTQHFFNTSVHIAFAHIPLAKVRPIVKPKVGGGRIGDTRCPTGQYSVNA